MSNTKYKLSYDEVRVIVIALVELKNQLIAEGRYTDTLLCIFAELLLFQNTYYGERKHYGNDKRKYESYCRGTG